MCSFLRRGRTGGFRPALGAAAAVYVLVLTGAFVRATGASWACVGWPGCNGEALPFGADRLVDIQLFHRLLAYGVCLFAGYVAWQVWRSERNVPGLVPAGLGVAASILGCVSRR